MATTLQNAGLTPQQPIVNPDGTATVFFFRWLLSGKTAALTAGDLEMLNAVADGQPDAALADAIAAAGETAMGAQFAGARVSAALAEGEAEDRYALEALIGAPAPADIVYPTGRDVLANIPAGFGAGDAGRTFFATDYGHRYRWTGAAWAYDDTDLGGGFIQWFFVAPRSAAAKAWQLCNGAAGITESRADGTTGLVQFPGLAAGTMPNLIGAYLKGAAAANGVITAVTPPTVASGGVISATDLHPTPAAATGGGPGAFLTGFDNPHTHAITPFVFNPGDVAHADAMPYYRL